MAEPLSGCSQQKSTNTRSIKRYQGYILIFFCACLILFCIHIIQYHTLLACHLEYLLAAGHPAHRGMCFILDCPHLQFTARGQNKPSYLFISLADSRSVFISFTMLLSLYLSIYLSIHSSIQPPLSLSPSKPFYHFLSIIFQPSLLAKYHQLPKFHISSISRRVAVVHLVQQPPDYSNCLENSMNSAFFPI